MEPKSKNSPYQNKFSRKQEFTHICPSSSSLASPTNIEVKVLQHEPCFEWSILQLFRTEASYILVLEAQQYKKERNEWTLQEK